MVIDVSYIGNKGTRLPHNPQFLGPGYNMNDPKVLALGTAVLQADINSATAKECRNHSALSGVHRQRGAGPSAFPAVSGDRVPRCADRHQPVQLRSRPSWINTSANGLLFRTFYTWSELYNNRAESGQRGGGGVQNPINTQAGEWALSGDDVPHAFVFSGSYELPFGKNMKGFAGKCSKAGRSMALSATRAGGRRSSP